MTRFSILLATVLLSTALGGFLGRKYFTYVLFVGIEPILYPCPYSESSFADYPCTFQPHQPDQNIAVWWHGWPTQDDKRTVPQPSGNCLRDILFFDHLPPPPPTGQ
ncbi:MAG: hypothetical protein OXJ55_08775 [Caldilineaceae bacterium]|nr:hypothetical protein [Caldilineaceae bacterium]